MDNETKTISEFELTDPRDIMECFSVDITDELLSKAKIAAYLYGQEFKTDNGETKPFNPKTFPGKAVDILMTNGKNDIIEIFFDSNRNTWDSKVRRGDSLGRLGPDQMGQFFKTDFYQKMIKSLSERWPVSDPSFGDMLKCMAVRKFDVNTEFPVDGLDEAKTTFASTKNMPNKRVDLANKDITGDGKRDYSSTGRKIQNFSDMGVKGSSSRYYCWPNPKYEFKWSQWADWQKIKPLCKMTFVHNGRPYMISLAPYDENFKNRGFRGADTAWQPPLAWLTPGECDQVMELTIVQKFVRQCIKRINKYINMDPKDVYEKINNKEKLTVGDIEKTQRVIRHVVKASMKEYKADTYCWED